MADATTTTVKETTLHPDDSVVVSSLAVEWPGSEQPDPLLRMDKTLLGGAEPRTQYTYGKSTQDIRKILLSVPHSELPLEVVVSDHGQETTLQLQSKTVHEDRERPQIEYIYSLDGSEPTVRILRYL